MGLAKWTTALVLVVTGCVATGNVSAKQRREMYRAPELQAEARKRLQLPSDAPLTPDQRSAVLYRPVSLMSRPELAAELGLWPSPRPPRVVAGLGVVAVVGSLGFIVIAGLMEWDTGIRLSLCYDPPCASQDVPAHTREIQPTELIVLSAGIAAVLVGGIWSSTVTAKRRAGASRIRELENEIRRLDGAEEARVAPKGAASPPLDEWDPAAL